MTTQDNNVFSIEEYRADMARVVAHAEATGEAIVVYPDGRVHVVITIPKAERVGATARIHAPLWRKIIAWLRQPLGPSARCPVCKDVLRGPDMAYSRNGDCWDRTCKGSVWAQQRRSFAYGNTKISNDSITREMIDEADR